MIKTDRNRLHYRLSEADIRPSMQRLAILEYINSCYCHPTADEVYSELVKEHPTLSRTTVFSSLKLLSEKGLVNNIHAMTPPTVSPMATSCARSAAAYSTSRSTCRHFGFPTNMYATM